ncbi:hypothetical protein Gpo141_00013716 [Globisporangium polare]
MEWTGDLLRLSLDNSTELTDYAGGPLPARLQHQPQTHQRQQMHQTRQQSAHESISPLERSPAHGVVDEGLLLAEAEELLATLDAAAFAARTPSIPDSKKKMNSWIGAHHQHHQHHQHHRDGCPVTPSDGPPLKLKRTTFASSSRSLAKDASSSEEGVATDKTRPGSWRDRVKEEATQLRKVATKLEVQLLLMQQQSASSLTIRNKRVQIWQKLAERQLRVRQQAEAENLQLKAMMHEHLRGVEAQQLVSPQQQTLATSDLISGMPNYLRGPCKEPIQPTRLDAAVMSSVFEPLIHRLDTGYAEMEAVFRENGIHRQPPLEPRSFMERKTRRLGEPCQYMELGDLRTLPFPWRSVAHFTWHCNREWHVKDKPYEYPCVDRPNDTFAVNYRVTHKSFGANESANFKLAVRRYMEANRLVIVYTCQADGEQDLAGVRTSDVGWLVISEGGGVATHDMSTQPITTIQSCSHVVASGAEQVGHDRVNRLVNLMMCAFEEDVRLMNQTVDNKLLEEARASRSSSSFASSVAVHQAPEERPRELVDRGSSKRR